MWAELGGRSHRKVHWSKARKEVKETRRLSARERKFLAGEPMAGGVRGGTEALGVMGVGEGSTA